jgi:E3 ubiquitin-protein ligase SHPRH
VTEDEAHGAMAFLTEDATLRRLDKDDLFIEVPYLDQGGIRSAELVCIQLTCKYGKYLPFL